MEFADIRKAMVDGLGHPDYEDLEPFETVPGTVVVFFMDIRGFTKLSIALDNQELIRILQAITVASILSIKSFNGHIAEFTGDGIMAYFGGRRPTSEQDAVSALMAAGYMMREIKGPVNSMLSKNGDETVRVGMGLEFGNVLWTRIGLPETNQVKPISEVTFVAGKNSSHTKSWEVLLGKNIAEWVPEQFKEKAEAYKFQKENKDYTYDRYMFNWESFNTQLDTNQVWLEWLLKNKKLPAITPLIMSSNGSISTSAGNSSGPRPLKDQPFFRG